MQEQVISCDDLARHYRVGTQTVKALQTVSLNINKGEYVAIMGPSGSGKSTFMNIIGCLDTPTRGSYVLNGTDVSRLEDNDLAEIRNKEIGFVFQTFNLMPGLTALENVGLPMIFQDIPVGEREKRSRELLESVGLGDRINHKPSELSGGQQQRVAIARSLANNPDVILADEPTGNLDSKTGREVMEMLSELYQQGNPSTMIIVTHDESLTKYTGRTVHLKDGRIVGQ